MRVDSVPVESIAFTPAEFAEPSRRLRYEDGIATLADSIRQCGLLHPILVREVSTGRYVLVAGLRRLLAHLRLQRDHSEDPHWQNIAAHIYTNEQVQDVLLALAENKQRGDQPVSLGVAQAIQALPPSEQLAFVADIRREMAEQARGRQRGGKQVPKAEKGKTSAKLAQMLNQSPAWVERATAIVAAAEEDPEHFGPIARQMDDSGRCYGAYQRLLDTKRALEIRAVPTIHHPRENSFVAGDCLDILRTMPDNSWANVITDAPYGIGFNYDGWTEPSTPEEHWKALEPMVKECFRVVVPGGLVAIFQLFTRRHYFPEWFGPYGWTPFSELYLGNTFVDPRLNNRNASKRTDHGEFVCPLLGAIDMVVMLWKPGEDRARLNPDWKGRSRLNHMMRVNMRCKDPMARLHPCPRPVDLMERILHNWTMEGSSILDPMAGSGATCIAAHRLGRRWMGIDRSETYCQVAARRLQWYVEHDALPDNNDWSTEQEFWQELHKVFGFTVDAAANEQNAKLPAYWTRQQDALSQDWSKHRVWINPPFEHGKIEAFLEKAKTAELCVAIVPAGCLTTKYLKRVRPDYIAFPDRRIHFDPPTGPRRKTQHSLSGFPLLIYGALTEGQIVALESMHLSVFRRIEEALARD